MKKTFLINSNEENSRLDRWFKRSVCNVPQSLIEKNIRKGKIKVNYKIKKSSYKLKVNDEVKIFNINYSSTKLNKVQNKYIARFDNVKINSEGVMYDSMNVYTLNNNYYKKNSITKKELDKETSGVLIIAKNRKYAQLFTSLFRIRKIYKTYLCIILGEMKKKDKGKFIDQLFTYEGDKKVFSKAITKYEVIDSNNNYSLLKLNPETGRKHQLRKQLLIRGYPILGDNKYRFIDSVKNKGNNLMLHSYKINFTINGIKHRYIADLTDIFKKTLNEKYLKIFQQ